MSVNYKLLKNYSPTNTAHRKCPRRQKQTKPLICCSPKSLSLQLKTFVISLICPALTPIVLRHNWRRQASFATLAQGAPSCMHEAKRGGRVIKNRSSGKTVYNSDLSCIFWITKHNYEYWENEEQINVFCLFLVNNFILTLLPRIYIVLIINNLA